MALRLYGDGRIEEISELEIESKHSLNTPLVLIGSPEQEANLLEIKDHSDNVVMNIESGGNMKIHSNVVITEETIAAYAPDSDLHTFFLMGV
jgi:hypothetical protein